MDLLISAYNRYEMLEKEYTYLLYIHVYVYHVIFKGIEGRRSRDRMVVGFITTYAIGDYHH
jgi:hypothetical protein